MSELDLNTPGTYTAKIKALDTPVAGAEKKPIFVKIEGQSKALKLWPDQLEKFALPLEAGAEAQAEIQVKQRGDYMDAWLMSFGGPNKGKAKGGGGNYGGGGGGRSNWQPKSEAEIHAASICGIIKSVIEHTSPANFEQTFNMALDAYDRGIKRMSGKANAVPARPQEAEVKQAETQADPNADQKAEANAYWSSIGGTPEMLSELKNACSRRGLKSYEVILKGKESNADPAAIIRLASRELDGVGVAEPGQHRNPVESVPESDWYSEFRAIADAQGWPGFAEARPAWNVLLKRLFPNREFTKAEHFHPHDYYTLFLWAQRAERGEEDIPAGFLARAKESKNVETIAV